MCQLELKLYCTRTWVLMAQRLHFLPSILSLGYLHLSVHSDTERSTAGTAQA